MAAETERRGWEREDGGRTTRGRVGDVRGARRGEGGEGRGGGKRSPGRRARNQREAISSRNQREAISPADFNMRRVGTRGGAVKGDETNKTEGD